jgi:hypothetical protein
MESGTVTKAWRVFAMMNRASDGSGSDLPAVWKHMLTGVMEWPVTGLKAD